MQKDKNKEKCEDKKCDAKVHDINEKKADSKTDTADTAEVELEKLKEENQALKNQLLLAMADNENLRKRFDKEREDLIKYSASKFAKEILNVVDNVDRAIASIPDDDTTKTIKDGILMTKKEILSILQKNHIEPIKAAVGDEFNPHEHQAMMESPNPDLQNGTIATILQDGYKLHDRVLRPTMVSVVKNA